jgi:hypothetical protein
VIPGSSFGIPVAFEKRIGLIQFVGLKRKLSETPGIRVDWFLQRKKSLHGNMNWEFTMGNSGNNNLFLPEIVWECNSEKELERLCRRLWN